MLIILLCLLNSLQILHSIFNKNAQNYEVIIVHRLDFSSCPSFSWDLGIMGSMGKKIKASWQGELGQSSIYTTPRKAKNLSQHLHGERPVFTEVCSFSMQISAHRVPSWTCGTTQTSCSDPNTSQNLSVKMVGKEGEGGRRREKEEEERRKTCFSVSTVSFCFLSVLSHQARLCIILNVS